MTFGIVFVSGRIRVPDHAARRMAFMRREIENAMSIIRLAFFAKKYREKYMFPA